MTNPTTAITDAMLEAGVEAAEKQFWENVSEHDVRAIYLAMQSATPSTPMAERDIALPATANRPTGSVIHPTSSIEFMEYLPEEIRLHVKHLEAPHLQRRMSSLRATAIRKADNPQTERQHSNA